MPLKIELKPGSFALSDIWCSKQDFRDMGVEETIELLNEDPLSLLEELGWLKGIIARVYWEDES